MQISKLLKRVILVELVVPMVLLFIGIYHGLMQVVYRAGLLHKPSTVHLDYYQGLTLHGVINALVLTTFFAVAFGHATMSFYLKREPGAKTVSISMWLMIVGTVFAAIAMLSGNASVLYTFYPPLKAHPLFYLGAALLVMGSWVAFWGWISMYRGWRKETPKAKVPLAVLGTIINFTVWFVCTLAVAYEIVALLIPWSLGWVKTINVVLARTLFWFFGHALVYFWLLPAYIMYYTVLPKVAGGKLFSENAGRLVFFLFLILSVPVGVHHQFSEPGISSSTKILHSILTFGVAIPSFITAFTISASLEYAGWVRNAKGLFGWMRKLPYWDVKNFLFGYLICGLIMFVFGGFTGIVNSSYSLNNVVHNTSWLPGHFHMTVAGPVFLAILGMSLYLIVKLGGKEMRFRYYAVMVPYLWMIGIGLFSFGLMWGGLMGEPRRTNLGMTYLNPSSPLFRPDWVPSTLLTLFGGIIMTVAAVFFFISFFATLFSKKMVDEILELPVAEPLREEPTISILHHFTPWLVVMVIVIILAYIPALMDVWKYVGPSAPPYLPNSAIPVLK